MNYSTAAAVTFGAKVATFALSAVTAIALARWLGAEDRGAYAVVTTLGLGIVTAVNLGLAQAHVHVVGRDPTLASRAAANSLVFVGATSIVAAIVLLAGAPAIVVAFPTVEGAILLVLIASVPQGLLYPLLQAIMQARRDFAGTSALIVLSYALQLAILATLVGLLGLGLRGAIVAWFLAHLLIALVTAAIVIRRDGLARPDGRLLGRALRLGAVNYASSLALLVATRSGLVVAALLLPAAEVGLYAVALTVAELTWYLAESAAFGLAPFVATDGIARSRLTPVVSRIVLALSAVGALVAGGLADVILVPFGPEFAASAPSVRWLLPGVVAYSVAKVLSGDLLGRGRPDVSLVGLGLGGAVSVTAALALVPAYGIAGAAAASTIAYLMSALVLLAGYARLTGSPWSDLVVLRGADLQLVRRLARRFS